MTERVGGRRVAPRPGPVSRYRRNAVVARRARAWVVRGIAAAIPALSACAAPDRPAGLLPPLPEEAHAFLLPDSVRGLRLSAGVFYHFAWSDAGPWAVHLVSAQVVRCELDLVVVPALEEDGVTRTRRSVTQMVPRGPGRPLAGVNGDFFALDSGAPVGPEVSAATAHFAPRPAIAWGSSRRPWIGDPVRDGDRMVFGPDTIGPSVEAGAIQVIGGYPELLDSGAVAGDLGVSDRPSFAAARHPRTAVGFDRGSGLLWLVVVDGRQAPRSAGMSLPELAGLMQALGADDALNLDGGGSSAMSLRGRIVNRPSDATGERTVANSLWLIRSGSGCRWGAARRPGSGPATVPPPR